MEASYRDAPVKGDAVIIIVTNLDDDDFIVIAENLEFKENVLFVSDKTSPGAYPIEKLNCIIDDFWDIKSTIARISEWGRGRRFVGIIGLDEEYHYSITREVADAFKLRYYSKKTLDSTSNKFLQRQLLNECGVRVPKFELFSGEDPKIRFPNVLKVLTGYASIHNYLNHSPEELKKNLDVIKKEAAASNKDLMFKPHKIGDAKTFDPTTEFILEEYIGGEEYSCDYLVDQQGAHVIRVVKKIIDPGNFGGFEGFYLHNPDAAPSGFSLKELESLCTKIAKCLEIEFGVCMLDFKLINGEFVVIETTVRPGIATFVMLMAEVYGYISMNKLIREKLGVRFDLCLPSKTGLVAYFSTAKRGTVKRIDLSELDKRKDSLDMISSGVYYYDGEPIYDTSTCKTPEKLLGYALVRDVAYADINKKIKEIRNLIRVEVV